MRRVPGRIFMTFLRTEGETSLQGLESHAVATFWEEDGGMRGWPGTFAWIALLGCFGVGCFGQASSPPPEMPEMPAPVPDTQKITLTQALAQAQQNSPLLAAAGHEVAGAKANLSGQRAPVNPILNLTAITNTPDVFDPTDPTK